MKRIILLIILVLSTTSAIAQTVVSELDDQGKIILNEELRKLRERARELEDDVLDISTEVEGILPLNLGGTGVDLSSMTRGAIYYDNTSEGFVRLDPGTDGQFLETNGPGADPQWSDAPSFNVDWISTTTVTASNSGDITISTNKNYLVILEIEPATVNATSVNMLFNSDTNNYYEWSRYDAVIGSVEAHTGDGGDSPSITLHDGIGGNSTAGFLRYKLWINTKAEAGAGGGEDGMEGSVIGEYIAQSNDADDSNGYGRIYAVFTDEASATTSFEIVTSSNCDINVELYEITP